LIQTGKPCYTKHMNAQALLDQFTQAKNRDLIENVSVFTDNLKRRQIIDITLKTQHNPREQYNNLKRYLEAKGYKVSDLSLCNRLFYIFLN
jgi:hypothetical protein